MGLLNNRPPSAHAIRDAELVVARAPEGQI